MPALVGAFAVTLLSLSVLCEYAIHGLVFIQGNPLTCHASGIYNFHFERLIISFVYFLIILSQPELSVGIATKTAYQDFSFSILGIKAHEQRRPEWFIETECEKGEKKSFGWVYRGCRDRYGRRAGCGYRGTTQPVTQWKAI
jgi:hypothetical protein